MWERPLTTISVGAEDMSRAAGVPAAARNTGERPDGPHLLAPDLMIRESCGCGTAP